jgi:AcrR family transcriptional regulator
MDEVAKGARTTKTTVYKRFKNKTQLAEAAISHLGEQVALDKPARARDTASAVANFRHKAIEHRIVEVLAAVILAKRSHPEFAADFEKGVLGPHLANLRDELRRLGLRTNIETVTMQAMGYSVVEAVGDESNGSEDVRSGPE